MKGKLILKTFDHQPFLLGSVPLGLNHPPFIAAEMSGNHNHSLDRALELVDAAAKAGVHALKIQTYTADTMTINCDAPDFKISDPKSLWCGESLYGLYQKAHTPWEWHEPIFKRCREKGILGFSTPFDESAIEFLEKCGVPFYKIASFENTDLPLIRAAAKTKKPLIISTGMMTLDELDKTVKTARDAGCENLILLKCTSSYPADPKDSHLRTLPLLRQRYGCEIGLSDHTLGIGAAVASVSHGATFIEKHFTLHRGEGGVDSAFSLEPDEMRALVDATGMAWQAQGKAELSRTEGERKSLQFRRSIYIVQDVRSGETFSPENVRRIRPGYGLAPEHYETILGRKATSDLKRGTALAWNHVEGGKPS